MFDDEKLILEPKLKRDDLDVVREALAQARDRMERSYNGLASTLAQYEQVVEPLSDELKAIELQLRGAYHSARDRIDATLASQARTDTMHRGDD